MVWFIIGIIAAICSTAGFIPQIIRGIRTRSLRDVSPMMMALTLMGSSLWLIYGLHLKDAIIITANISIISFVIIILLLRALFKPEFVQLQKRLMSFSLKSRVILLFMIITLLPFLLLRITAYPQIQADIREALIRNIDCIAHKQAELVINWMHERVMDACVIANNPFVLKSVNITEDDKDYLDIMQYLKEINNEYGYNGILISNDKGLVTLATLEEEARRGVLQTEYFHGAMQGKTFVSGIIPSEIPLINEYGEKEVGMPTMFIASPLKGTNGIIIGVVTLRIDVSRLNELMSNLKIGKTGEAYLVNKDGYMISESRFAERLKEMGLVKKRCTLELKLTKQGSDELTYGVRQCVFENNGFDDEGYENYRGIMVLGAWYWLHEFNLGIVAEIDRNEGYGAAYNLNYMVTSVLLILAFPFVMAAYFLGRRISAPIIKLTEITEKMASGDLTQRVDIQREDEIGVLAKSFNLMAKSLDEKTKEVISSEKRYRELFNSIKEGVYQSEPGVEGVFTWINQSGAEILGYSSPEEVVGTRVKDMYVDPGDMKELIDKLEKEGTCRNFMLYCKRRNGERFVSEKMCNLERSEDGKPVRIQGIFIDITKRQLNIGYTI